MDSNNVVKRVGAVVCDLHTRVWCSATCCMFTGTAPTGQAGVWGKWREKNLNQCEFTFWGSLATVFLYVVFHLDVADRREEHLLDVCRVLMPTPHPFLLVEVRHDGILCCVPVLPALYCICKLAGDALYCHHVGSCNYTVCQDRFMFPSGNSPPVKLVFLNINTNTQMLHKHQPTQPVSSLVQMITCLLWLKLLPPPISLCFTFVIYMFVLQGCAILQNKLCKNFQVFAWRFLHNLFGMGLDPA